MTHIEIRDRIIVSPYLENLDLPAAIAAQRAVGEVPGMLSYGERALLWSLLAKTWRGDGAVIDGGSFFGTSLHASASGMVANPGLAAVDLARFPAGKPIHAYELGYLPAPANPKADRHRAFGGTDYVMGESFVPILEETTRPFASLIELHIGDLNDEKWDGTPIEIAFIDVCKTAQLNAHVSQQFYPSLIGGASTLINQDFFFDRLPWIRVTMGYLADYFRWEGQVYTSSVYTSLKPVPADVASYDPFTEASYDECLRYHDAVEFPGLGRKSQLLLALSRAYLMALKDRKDEALDTLRLAGEEYVDILGDDDNPRGNQFRLDRATRQITNGKV